MIKKTAKTSSIIFLILADFLKWVNCTVNIQVGGDEGYLDYVLIQSLKEMGSEIAEIENRWGKFVKEYSELLAEVGDLKELWQIEYYKRKFQTINLLLTSH